MGFGVFFGVRDTAPTRLDDFVVPRDKQHCVPHSIKGPLPPHGSAVYGNISSLCIAGGLSLPTERWAEIMKDVNAKIEALEIDYENICIENKVSVFSMKKTPKSTTIDRFA